MLIKKIPILTNMLLDGVKKKKKKKAFSETGMK